MVFYFIRDHHEKVSITFEIKLIIRFHKRWKLHFWPGLFKLWIALPNDNPLFSGYVSQGNQLRHGFVRLVDRNLSCGYGVIHLLKN